MTTFERVSLAGAMLFAAVLAIMGAAIVVQTRQNTARLDELERLERNASTGTVHMGRLVIGGGP